MPEESEAAQPQLPPFSRAAALSLAFFLVGCSPPPDAGQADQVVSQLQDTLSPIPTDEFCAMGIAKADGTRDPGFVCPTAKDGELRASLYKQITAMGRPGAAALGRAYQSPNVKLRRGAALALEELGGGYDPRYSKLDLKAALPALKNGLKDEDELVRSWSAQALSHLGSRAASAVPALIEMLASAHEGDRNGACIGLGGIGPAARAAVPALKRALNDPSHDVRGFAQSALLAIGD